MLSPRKGVMASRSPSEVYDKLRSRGGVTRDGHDHNKKLGISEQEFLMSHL